MTNKEKFLKLVSEDSSNTLEWAKKRRAGKNHSLLSKKIGIRILARLDVLDWKQVNLATAMGVSAQQVNKWVKGSENFTIETLVNLGEALGIDLIQVSPLEDKATSQKELSMQIDYEKNVRVVRMFPNNFIEQVGKFDNASIAL